MIPQELRIGNWVNDPSSIGKMDSYGQVKELNTDTLVLEKTVSDTITRYYYLEPIELSPEILEKAGFDFLGSCQVLKLDKYFSLRTYDSTGSDIYLDFDGDSEWRSYNNHRCKHLHQLQNLIFSLTGIELEIKF